MKQNVFSITTTLPYVNAKPHIGFAFEIVGADILARYHRLKNEKVFFNTGTDEHGQKIFEKALELGLDPQAYCDQLVVAFEDLRDLLDLSWTNFVRTTDSHHQQAAQEMWRRCEAAGDIYKSQYEVKYCVGCELEKTDSELVAGRCPLHPQQDLELRKEENYFFRFSRYGERLLAFYQENPSFVQPKGKMTEIESLVSRGLKDFSISRVKAKMPWGVPVPGDDEQVMYVWFDALTNYISTLGWPEKELNPEMGWPAIQVAGKDNLRQQAAMWQAMLMSADLPNSQQILINGFILVDGQKMSKSLNNVIAPTELVDSFGTQATRYLLANLGSFNEDIDLSWDKLKNTYQANLTNGLGNLCSRVAKMAESVNLDGRLLSSEIELNNEYTKLLDEHKISEALWWVNEQVNATDKYLSQEQPWKISDQAQKSQILNETSRRIIQIAYHLLPYLPQTAQRIIDHFQAEKVVALTPLFPRLES